MLRFGAKLYKNPQVQQAARDEDSIPVIMVRPFAGHTL
jgi:hypothetical protein